MAACWQWKSDLLKPDADASAWSSFSEVDSERIERARRSGKEEVELNGGKLVNIKELLQYQWRPVGAVRRLDGARPAAALQAASPSGSASRSYEQLNPRETDLGAEAERRCGMAPPSQDQLFFFWYGQWLKQRGPKLVIFNRAGESNSSYKSMACCQRTKEDTYKLKVKATRLLWIGFVHAEDFGFSRAFPYLTLRSKSGGGTVGLGNDAATGKDEKITVADIGEGCQMQLTICPHQLRLRVIPEGDGRQQLLSFPLETQLKDTAVLTFWMYEDNDSVELL